MTALRVGRLYCNDGHVGGPRSARSFTGWKEDRHLDPTVALFAIEAAHSRLLLPVGELFGAMIDSEAIEFFGRDEHQSLTAPGGPDAGCDRAQLITAYRTLLRVEAALGGDDLTA